MNLNAWSWQVVKSCELLYVLLNMTVILWSLIFYCFLGGCVKMCASFRMPRPNFSGVLNRCSGKKRQKTIILLETFLHRRLIHCSIISAIIQCQLSCVGHIETYFDVFSLGRQFMRNHSIFKQCLVWLVGWLIYCLFVLLLILLVLLLLLLSLLFVWFLFGVCLGFFW